MDVFASTHGTDTPGVMDEDDVRAWAGYSPKEWADVREVFSRLFNLRKRRGKWILTRVREDHEASKEIYLRRVHVAQMGVEGRRRTKDLATGGPTDGGTDGATSGQPGVQPTVRQELELDSEKRKRTDKTESDSRSKTARARVGSAGSAGSSPSSPLPGIIERATGRQLRSERRGA
jgi:uncharacterized protein YdaU (DUF1376 family)